MLDLVFHDTEDDGDALDHLPERWHLEQVARFLAGLPTQNLEFSLHVHCYAGVSRSTAVASFVLASLTLRLNDAQIVRQVLAARPQAVPNQLLPSCCSSTPTNCWAASCTAPGASRQAATRSA